MSDDKIGAIQKIIEDCEKAVKAIKPRDVVSPGQDCTVRELIQRFIALRAIKQIVFPNP